ncbi:hypothetical protein QWY31_06535 [Cytophagales bacterium LB-30]|uniref:DUF4440 domain-containing protein n=1 Tax=Shiella aurantiaca TaxID=3058365 RepID=A0ABT8F3W7_9BACT|nr:hypothetical protein [Shiella aurantiaca]MDN4165150.1 hypothetical protein [Shiella aurantiaca]
MWKAEQGFAQMASDSSVKQAFLHFLHPEAYVFTPKAENGHAVYSQRPEGGPLLEWAPAWVVVSQSGEMALSTGCFQVLQRDNRELLAQGQFVSVWMKDSLGNWRVMADMGNVGDCSAAAFPASRQLNGLNEARDKKLPQAVNLDHFAAGSGIHASGKGIHFREQMKDNDLLEVLAVDHAEILYSQHSQAGDMAYSLGRYERKTEDKILSGSFLAIWHRHQEGWKILWYIQNE